jgi:hypothetical protein
MMVLVPAILLPRWTGSAVIPLSSSELFSARCGKKLESTFVFSSQDHRLSHSGDDRVQSPFGMLRGASASAAQWQPT